jgi:hypothetical protein
MDFKLKRVHTIRQSFFAIRRQTPEREASLMNRFNSIFGQILHLFSKREFFEAVYATQAERGAKGFSCWDQFVAMLFCQRGQAHSLREICGGLASCFGKAKHLGLKKAPKRSTLSYANEHRPWQLYERTFYQFLGKCRSLDFGKRRFRFKNKLFFRLFWTAVIQIYY